MCWARHRYAHARSLSTLSDSTCVRHAVLCGGVCAARRPHKRSISLDLKNCTCVGHAVLQTGTCVRHAAPVSRSLDNARHRSTYEGLRPHTWDSESSASGRTAPRCRKSRRPKWTQFHENTPVEKAQVAGEGINDHADAVDYNVPEVEEAVERT